MHGLNARINGTSMDLCYMERTAPPISVAASGGVPVGKDDLVSRPLISPGRMLCKMMVQMNVVVATLSRPKYGQKFLRAMCIFCYHAVEEDTSTLRCPETPQTVLQMERAGDVEERHRLAHPRWTEVFKLALANASHTVQFNSIIQSQYLANARFPSKLPTQFPALSLPSLSVTASTSAVSRSSKPMT